MDKQKKLIFIILALIIFCVAALVGFFAWNFFPLPKVWHPNLEKISSLPCQEKEAFTAISYNINFGMGRSFKRQSGIDKESFLKRLDGIAAILKKENADIVFLQEVDFHSRRTHYIDQAIYLAKKAEYPYIAKAPLLIEKFHLNFQNRPGPINFGLAILSKLPLYENVCRIFDFPKEMPFYLKWLFIPHGAQIVLAKYHDRMITLINVHLEPWSQHKREKEAMEIAYWLQEIPSPIILAGDFNCQPPETQNKTSQFLLDAPWFIKRSAWDLDNEKTISALRQVKDFNDIKMQKTYLTCPEKYYTYASYNPYVKIDYIFAGKGIRIKKSKVLQNSKGLSDHLPIKARIKPCQPATTPPMTSNIKNQSPASKKSSFNEAALEP